MYFRQRIIFVYGAAIWVYSLAIVRHKFKKYETVRSSFPHTIYYTFYLI